jgi:hypothetical protein
MKYEAKTIVLLSPLNEVAAINDCIKKSSANWLKNHTIDEKLCLHHYTNLSGFKGIITERAIWCTNIFSLNDPSELKYGSNIILEHLEKYINKEEHAVIHIILKRIKEFILSMNPMNANFAFVASFCENDNLLSQWRIYASKGGGYNLGFSFNSETCIGVDSNKIDSGELNPIKRKLNLRRIIYDPTEQALFIDNYLSDIINGLKSSENEWSSDYKKNRGAFEPQVAMAVVNTLIDMMFSMKNPVFQEENEWRLIRVIRWDEIPKHYKFREETDELIPYLCTYLYNEQSYDFPLNKIKIGPMLERIKSKTAIDLFIKHSATSDSKIHLRRDISIEHAGYSLR